MRIVRSCLLILPLVAPFTVLAQLPSTPRGSGGFIGGFNLIAMPAVQQELQLDEKQKAKAKEVAGRMGARFNQDIGKLKGLNADEQAKRRVALADPHYEEGMRELGSFLKPAQLDRFDQILMQQRGPMAMLEPKIAPVLKITNEQAQQIAGLMAETQNEQRAAVRAAGKDQRAVMIQVEAIAAHANQKAMALLSPEQQKTWQRLNGEPFRPDLGGGASEQPAPGATPKR